MEEATKFAYTRLFMLRSTMDVVSMAIDFSKGNMKESVVDNLPSRGPVKTLICLPSPLKWTASTPNLLRSQSPTSRVEMMAHKKLYGDAKGDSQDS